MIIKYISFLIGIIWSYSIIKTQSVFSKKTGIIFKIFITKVSWLTLIAACYFGYKNFSIKFTIIGIIIGILLVNLAFYFSKKFIYQRFDEQKIKVYSKKLLNTVICFSLNLSLINFFEKKNPILTNKIAIIIPIIVNLIEKFL